MRILVVGGTGHIGSYLVPRLVRAGHEVLVVARNPRPQYTDPRIAWPKVEWVVADRRAEEAEGAWKARMEGIEADVVCDLICYTPEQHRLMVEAFDGRVSHFLHCGTIWAYGPPGRVPYEEHYPRKPLGDYGRMKAEIEADLIGLYQKTGFPATIIHPGHISGRKWLPIDPQGTRDGVGIYRKLALGEVVHLPKYGRETLQHVHADDIGQLFESAIHRRQNCLGESFSAVAPYAMSLVELCEFTASLFGRAANIEFADHEEMPSLMGAEAWEVTEGHIDHSPCCSIEKCRRLLGYEPRYTTEQIYVECIEYLLETGELQV